MSPTSNPGAVAASDVPNGCVFIDHADLIFKFKDSTEVVHKVMDRPMVDTDDGQAA